MKTAFLTLSQIRQIECEALEKYKLDLMNLAAEAITEWFIHNMPAPKSIIVLVGKGNNGGDGVISAIKLQQLGYQVSLIIVQKTVNSRTKELINLFKLQQHGKVLSRRPNNFSAYDVIIDAVLGIGVKGELDASLVHLINLVNESCKFILAIDTPTGLDPFTATISNAVVHASHTITFISDKAGFHTGSGIDYHGGLTIAPLVNLNDYSFSEDSDSIYLNNLDSLNYQILRRKKQNTNKGSFGYVAIIGGAKNMHGALYLAGRAALLLGAGKVVLGSLDNDFRLDMNYPELMLVSPKEILKYLENYAAIVVGPGMGMSDKAVKIVANLIEYNPQGKLIFDADALNILAKYPQLNYKFKSLINKVITPHPKEAARLLDSTIMMIQHNRFDSVARLAEMYRAHVLLKGAGSLIKNFGCMTYLNQTGNCALSSGGQGDVLSGMIASIAAQGMELDEALRLAVYLHGLSADDLVVKMGGNNGILATETAINSRQLLNKILY